MALTNEAVRQQICYFIQRRYETTADQPMYPMTAPSDVFLRVEQGLIRFLMQERAAVWTAIQTELEAEAALDEVSIMPLFLRMTQQTLYQHNQFISLSAAQLAQLEQVYRNFLNELAALLVDPFSDRDIALLLQSVLEQHFFRLGAFMASLHDSHEFVSQHVVCREYTPEMQLALMGIDPASLMSPILDVGCGEHGYLVRHLRALGLAAYGADRIVDEANGLTQADWLQLRFPAATWGTIISHMAFSNHFRFHHLYRDGVPEQYAQQYMRFLASLKPGGMLIYTPGLDFMEALLPPSRYHVQQKSIAANPFYATHITCIV